MGIDYSFDSWNNGRDNEEPTSSTMPGRTLPAARQMLVQVLEQSHLIYLPLPRKEPSNSDEFSKIIEAYHLFEVPTSFLNLLIFWWKSSLNRFHNIYLLLESTVILI